MRENNINALDEISKGASMGMDAIDFILDKVEDKKFKEVIEKQYDQYKDISNRIEKIYPSYSEDEPHKTNIMNKAMTWYGIEMKTLTDHSDSKISELLLQGTNMGIIEGKKILNHKEMDKEVKDIMEDYVNMQEEAVEKLKCYL